MKKLAVLLPALLLFGPGAARAEEAEPTNGVVYSIPIRGAIEPALLYVIRRGVAEANATGAKAIVFVMDTPGGTVNAAKDIVRTIHTVNVPTYTFIEKDAFSAGAIIAMATRHIYMAPGSVIGDAMPIMMTPFGGPQEMPEALQEKMVSAVAALMRAAAEQGGHDKDLAEKMVRRETEYTIGDEVIGKKGQLLTLTNVEAERKVGPDQRPLLSLGTVKDLDELLDRMELGDATVRELRVTMAERVARFIAALAPVFLMIGLLGIYIEVKTPGFGLPGITGIVCLAIFFWGHHIAGLAGMEDIVLFLIGLVLLLVELLLIPGFGVIGVTGITLMIWAALSAMTHRYPGTPWWPTWEGLQQPLINLSLALVGTGILAGILARFLPRTPIFHRLVLNSATSRQSGFAASTDQPSLVGQEGTALSPLRPGGTALFGERKLAVVTRGDFVQPQARIRIVESHGNRIVVEPVDSTQKG